jgi:hypothetical protein
MHTVILDNIGPPTDTSSVRPIIRFANQEQQFSPDILRSIIRGPIERKLDMKLSGKNALLIWSQHRSFHFCVPENCNVLADLLMERMRSPFVDVVYFHRSVENIVVLVMHNRQLQVGVKEEL